MAIVRNSEVFTELRQATKISPGGVDNVPNFLSSGIVPVIEVNPKLLKNMQVAQATITNSSSGAIFISPADRDCYIIGYQLSMMKDATATSVNTQIRTVVNGALTYIAGICGITLTAQQSTISGFFTHPLKIDRSASTNVINSTAVANNVACGTVYYFLDETSNG